MTDTLFDLAPRDDNAALRRRLASMHDDLRSRGYNPLEALQELADAFSGTNDLALNLAETLQADSVEDVSSLAWTAFQEFLTTDLRGAFGQYLTPPDVARHVANLLGSLAPGVSVADPFLGSGILLHTVASKGSGLSLYGYEINEAVAHVGKAALNLAGHTVTIRVADSFNLWVKSQFKAADVIVTNPPFGASLVTLDQLMLHNHISSSLSSMRRVPVELLAMEMCMDCLKPEGVLVIVLPNSVLTNHRFGRFRAEFFAKYTLEHVTQLAEATFAPFRGVARASVLVIRKASPVNLPYRFTQEISKSAGYDATGRPQGVSDLNSIIERVKKDGTGHLMTIAADGEIYAGDRKRATEAGFRLGDIADIFRGKNPGRDEYQKTGPILLKVGGLSGSFISWRERERSRISLEFFRSSPSKQLRPGDVCFTGTAHTPRYICQKVDLISDLPAEGAMPSGEVIVVRLREGAPISPLALLYYLRSDEGKQDVQRLIKGSTAHVYPKDLAGLTIPDLSALVDMPSIEKLHEEAEKFFRKYLFAEDRIADLLGILKQNHETGD